MKLRRATIWVYLHLPILNLTSKDTKVRSIQLLVASRSQQLIFKGETWQRKHDTKVSSSTRARCRNLKVELTISLAPLGAPVLTMKPKSTLAWMLSLKMNTTKSRAMQRLAYSKSTSESYSGPKPESHSLANTRKQVAVHICLKLMPRLMDKSPPRMLDSQGRNLKAVMPLTEDLDQSFSLTGGSTPSKLGDWRIPQSPT